MAKLILIITTLFLNCFAEETLSPAVNNIETLYRENKQILQECLNKRPSQNKSLGCVDSFKYINALCEVKREANFKKRYKKIPIRYFEEACELNDFAEYQMPSLFDLDAKSCVNGYETISDRLETLSKNKSFLDESFAYVYEKNSCKDFRNYVNFCSYVDGDLKKTLPTDYEHLPKLDLSINDVCKPKNSNADGLYTLNYDLASLAEHKNTRIYEKLILDYRSRMPASKNSKFSVCEEVRASYENLRCVRFEKIKDGVPIYYTSEEMRNKRIQNNAAGSAKGAN